MNIGRKHGFGEEMDWLKEILSWPMEWSVYNGVETVKTPYFETSERACRHDTPKEEMEERGLLEKRSVVKVKSKETNYTIYPSGR
jgi:hypothetical protein